jgi:hypothetical protein
MESEGRQMKPCRKQYIEKNPKKSPLLTTVFEISPSEAMLVILVYCTCNTVTTASYRGSELQYSDSNCRSNLAADIYALRWFDVVSPPSNERSSSCPDYIRRHVGIGI